MPLIVKASSIPVVHLDLYELLLCRLLDPLLCRLLSHIQFKNDFTEPARIQIYRIAGVCCPDAYSICSRVSSTLSLGFSPCFEAASQGRIRLLPFRLRPAWANLRSWTPGHGTSERGKTNKRSKTTFRRAISMQTRIRGSSTRSFCQSHFCRDLSATI